MHRLRIALFALTLSRSATAQEAPAGDQKWGWLIVAGAIVAGAAVTTYGLSIDCQKDDTDCHRRAALPIWGGVGIAATGSLIGIRIVEFD